MATAVIWRRHAPPVGETDSRVDVVFLADPELGGELPVSWTKQTMGEASVAGA